MQQSSRVSLAEAECQGPLALPLLGADEEQIGIALHWTKKAVKKLLRGVGSREELQKNSRSLKQVLQGFPNGLSLPNGDICKLGHAYLNIAEHVLTTYT